MYTANFTMCDASCAARVIAGASCDNFGPRLNAAQEIHLIFQCCICRATRDHRHYSAGHAAIEKCAVPATMRAAQRVSVIKFWGTAECDAALRDAVERVVEERIYWWACDFAAPHCLHKLKTRQRKDRRAVGQVVR